MTISPTQAECVLAVARTGSFRRASAEVYLAQPSVSAHVAALERSLGVVLFDRQSNGAVLTPAGRRVLPYLQSFLDSREAVVRESLKLASRRPAPLRIASHKLGFVLYLPDAVRVLQATFTDLEVEMQMIRGPAGIHMVAEGTVDLALSFVAASYPMAENPALEYQVLDVSPTSVFVPPGHRLAGRTEIAAAELAGETVVHVGGKGSTAHARWHTDGVSNVRSVAAPDGTVAFDLATSGVGIVLTIEASRDLAPPDWTSAVITGGLDIAVGITRRASDEQPPACEVMWELLKQRAQRNVRGG